MKRHELVKEIWNLCEQVHDLGGWDEVPWSPNKRVLCLESIDKDVATFSVYAPFVEAWGRSSGHKVKLPVSDLDVDLAIRLTENAIRHSPECYEARALTKISERPTSFDLHMRPTTPGAQGPSGGATLPLETLGGGAGPADSGTDRTPHVGGYRMLPVKPGKSGMNVHEYYLPGAAPIDGAVKGKKEATVDHMGTAAPGNRRQPIGTPEYSEADEILPDKEMGRTNVHGVAVPEWSSAGQIDPNQAAKFAQTRRDENGVLVHESDAPWMRAWETALETHHPALTAHDIAPENHRREEMGRKDFQHAIAVIIRDGRHILMGKAHASDDRDGYWCFPGGGIDSEDGSDPVAAAIREAYEEAGLRVTSKGTILTHPDKPTCAFVVCEFADRPDREPQPNQEFSEFMWLDWIIREETGLKIYPPNKSILEQIPQEALHGVRNGQPFLETTALKRQKPNKRAWAVSSNSRRVTTGVNSEPSRRSKAGSSDRTKDRPSDKAVAATQGIKGKHTLSTPSAAQDSAEKLHFQAGSKNPRKAAQDKTKELDRVKQGRDPAALKPGDEGTPGKADAEKEGKSAGGGGGGASPGAKKPAGGATMPTPAQAATMPVNDLVQAAQAVLAAAGVGGGAAPGGAGAASPAQGPQKPAAGAKPGGKAGGATASDSPASREKKDQQTKAQSPGATTPTGPQQQQQQPGQAAPPGQMPQQQQPQGPQQGTQPGQSAGAGGINQQAPQPGPQGQQQQPGMQGQQQAPQQPGMQQAGVQPQPVQPTQGMPQGQPGINGDMTAPGMQPQGMPAFQQRVVDLVLKDRGNAEKCFRWLEALGFTPSTPDHTTVQLIVNTHEEMFLVQRTAKVFGLEMAGILPQ